MTMKRFITSLLTLFFLFLSGGVIWSQEQGNDSLEDAIGTQEQKSDFEIFLLPKQAHNFTEQQLTALVKYHKRGDLSGAATIQRKLAKYYEGNGKTHDAEICKQRADAAEAILNAKKQEQTKQFQAIHNANKNNSLPKQAMPTSNAEQSPQASGFSGNYYAMQNNVLHTWDFYPNGTFLHRTVVSGSGTGVGKSERGTFTISEGLIELRITKSTMAFVTPGLETHGRQTTQLGSGQENKDEVRRLKFQLLGSNGKQGIMLDGIEMNIKKW